MWRPDVCIYHGNCQDGFGAAWMVWKRWPDCEFVPASYGKPPPNVAGKNVLMVDFSYKRPVIEAMSAGAASIVILDHHKTAEADLTGLKTIGEAPHPNGGGAEEVDAALLRDGGDLPNVLAVFDMERSGAWLAWFFCHARLPPHEPPMLVSYIQDRDLWRFNVLGSREIHAFLSSHPLDFELWNNFAREIERADVLPLFMAEGASVLRVHRQNTQKLLEDAYIGHIDGHDVPMVNAPYNYASDVGNDLLIGYPTAPFSATWYRRADGKVQISLRSTNDRLDVSEIAKVHGGGGHRNAAGFEIDPPVLP